METRIIQVSTRTKWVDAIFEGKRIAALVFDVPSQYGVGGGRVSKLTISPDETTKGLGLSRCVYNYDRGLDFDKVGSVFVLRVISFLEANVK